MGIDEIESGGDVLDIALDAVAGAVFPPLKGKLKDVAVAWLVQLEGPLREWFDLPPSEGAPPPPTDTIVAQLGAVQQSLASITETLGEISHELATGSIKLTRLEGAVLQARIELIVHDVVQHVAAINLRAQRYAIALHELKDSTKASGKREALLMLRQAFADAVVVSEKMVDIRSVVYARDVPMQRVLMEMFEISLEQGLENCATDTSSYLINAGLPIPTYAYGRLLEKGEALLAAEVIEKIVPTFRFIFVALLQALVLLDAAHAAGEHYMSQDELTARKKEVLEFAAQFKKLVDDLSSGGFAERLGKAIEKYGKRLNGSWLPVSPNPPIKYSTGYGTFFSETPNDKQLPGWPAMGDNVVMWAERTIATEGMLDNMLTRAQARGLIAVDAPWLFGPRKCYKIGYAHGLPSGFWPESYTCGIQETTLDIPRPVLDRKSFKFVDEWDLSVLTSLESGLSAA